MQRRALLPGDRPVIVCGLVVGERLGSIGPPFFLFIKPDNQTWQAVPVHDLSIYPAPPASLFSIFFPSRIDARNMPSVRGRQAGTAQKGYYDYERGHVRVCLLGNLSCVSQCTTSVTSFGSRLVCRLRPTRSLVQEQVVCG